MNVKTELLATRGVTDAMQLNEVELDPFAIKAIMINEVVPVDPSQDFYGKPGADYSKSALSLFKNAGAKAESTYDLLREGVYLTNAVKTPKKMCIRDRLYLGDAGRAAQIVVQGDAGNGGHIGEIVRL